MKRFLLLTFIVITLGGCREEKTTTAPTIIADYYAEKSLPAAIMGSANNDGKMVWHAFGPATWALQIPLVKIIFSEFFL